MATTQARYHSQRRVTRGAWEPRFTKQRVIKRGTDALAVPVLTSISPTTIVHGAANGTVTCTGTGFVDGVTMITLDRVDQPTTFVSATSVTFTMRHLSRTNAGTRSVNVRNGTLFSTTPKTFTYT